MRGGSARRCGTTERGRPGDKPRSGGTVLAGWGESNPHNLPAILTRTDAAFLDAPGLPAGFPGRSSLCLQRELERRLPSLFVRFSMRKQCGKSYDLSGFAETMRDVHSLKSPDSLQPPRLTAASGVTGPVDRPAARPRPRGSRDRGPASPRMLRCRVVPRMFRRTSQNSPRCRPAIIAAGHSRVTLTMPSGFPRRPDCCHRISRKEKALPHPCLPSLDGARGMLAGLFVGLRTNGTC